MIQPRFALATLLFPLLVACGLSAREQSVSSANAAIRAVDESNKAVAESLASLPEGALTPDDFQGVRAAVIAHMEKMESTNAALRAVGAFFPELQKQIDETFRPEAEKAATACQEALDTSSTPTASQDDFLHAVTRVGFCVDRYATAVTSVSEEYTRLSGG